MFWKELREGAKNVVSGVIHAGNNIAFAIGIDTAAIGAFFLNMSKDDSGVYHANFDSCIVATIQLHILIWKEHRQRQL